MPTYQFRVLQFLVPKSIGNAINRARVSSKAAAAGLPSGRFEYSEVRTPPNRGRVTCAIEVAPVLIETLAEMCEGAAGQQLIDGLAALKSAQDALAEHLGHEGR